MFIIPSKETKSFSQPNTGEVQGNIWSSFGLDLTRNRGRLQTARTLDVVDSLTSGYSAMLTPIAFAFYNFGSTLSSAPIFAAYAGKVWYGTDRPDQGWTTTIAGNEPNVTTKPLDVDMKVFNNSLYATTHGSGNHIIKRITTGGAWTDLNTIGSGNTPNLHILEVYANRLYWTQDDYKLFSMNTSETTATSGSFTLQLTGRNGHISWVKAGSNRIWIGWTSSDGTRGSVFEWDGVSENLYSKEYKIEAKGSCTCVIKNDIPYVLDTEGRLLAFNGSNFAEVARLPVTNSEYPLQYYIANTAQKLAHFNGSLLVNDQILFFINPLMSGTDSYIENCPAGIWEYDEKIGLYHKFGVSTNKIAESPVYDYGQEELVTSGALFDGFTSSSNASFASGRQGSVLFGANAYRTSSSQPYLIGIDNTVDDVKKSAYVVTPFMETSQVVDSWNKIVVKYKKLLNASDSVKVKYRTIKRDAQRIAVTWTSTTTFTTTDSNMANYVAGDEVEIVSGSGAGKVVNISSISFSTPTYTVTIDETISSLTGTGIVRLQKWINIPITQNELQYQQLQIPQYNKDIQLQIKVIFEWTSRGEMNEIIVSSNTDQSSK